MRSPAAAIAWEFWARLSIWKVLAWLTSAGVICAICYQAAPGRADRNYWNALYYAFAFLPVLLTFLHDLFDASYVQSMKKANVKTSFPVHRLRLPVADGELVLASMVPPAVTAFSLCVVFVFFAFAFAFRTILPIWTPLVAVVIFAWDEAICWGSTSVTSGIARMVMPVIQAAFLLLEFSTATIVAVLLLQLPLAYYAALIGVRRARHGIESRSVSAIIRGLLGKEKRTQQGADVASLSSKTFDAVPFPSPQKAIRWVDWRLRGKMAIALVLFAASFCICIFFAGSHEKSKPIGSASFAFALISLYSVGGSAAFGNFGSTPGLSFKQRAFDCIRPVTELQIVRAKFVLAAQFIFSASLFAASSLTIVAIANNASSEMWREWLALHKNANPVSGAALLVTLFFVYAFVLWSCSLPLVGAALTGRKLSGLAAAGVIMISVIVFGLSVFTYLVNGPDILGSPFVLSAMLGTPAIVKLASTIWSVRQVHRSGLMPTALIVKLIAGWAVGAVALFCGAYVTIPPFAEHWQLLACSAALISPLGSYFLCPLALAWNRHR